jgi:hypothetical protein
MMKFGPRPRLQGRATRPKEVSQETIDARPAKHPGETVAAGIIFGR